MPDASSAGRLGCARHATVIGGLLLVALAVVVARNWDGVSRVALDAQAMAEGAEEARALQTPEDLLAWIRAHPGRASLVVWDVAGDSAVLALQPDVPRPAVGLPSLLLAAELARQSAAGLDTARTVSPSALRPLPGVERGRTDTAAVSLATLARRALGADRAAADALLHVLGREAVEAAPARFGLDGLDAPLPLGGLFLAWVQEDGPVAGGLLPDRPLLREEARDVAFDLSQAHAADPSFRAAVAEKLERRGLGLTRAEQRRLAAATFPQGTASAYARLLARAAASELESPEASRTLLRFVVRPVGGGKWLGIVGGGFPGHIGTAGVQTAAGGGRVVVLLVEDVPDAVLLRLSQSGLDAGLVIDLLMASKAVSGDSLRKT